MSSNNHLRAWRIAKGLTLAMAAELSGTTASTLSKLERSKLRATVDWLDRLADVYEATPQSLLEAPGGQSARKADGQESESAPEAGLQEPALKGFAKLPLHYRAHIQRIVGGLLAKNDEEVAFIEADIFARQVEQGLDLPLKATQRALLIERALGNAAVARAAKDHTQPASWEEREFPLEPGID